MKFKIIFVLAVLLLTAGCSFSAPENHPTNTPPVQDSQKLCGDGFCDGPENNQNCAEDCPAVGPISMKQDEKEEAKPEMNNEEKPKQEAGDGDYRKVSFSGTIITSLNQELMGDFTGDAFEYSGDYSIELWFPLEGGQAIKQRNSIVLTDFRDLYIGESDCRPCTWQLDDSAFIPYSFKLDTQLNLETYMEENEPADELVTQLMEIPLVTIQGFVECPCPGSGDTFSDPAAYPALMTYFMQKLVHVIQIQSIETHTTQDFPASPMFNISIPEETLAYVMVDNLEN
ncbi:MAG: hypothetical protein JEZ06_24495 [Anaerolineaceae bacterium]|nr:hypothetical protein [Anaerolineaceae bacterium]